MVHRSDRRFGRPGRAPRQPSVPEAIAALLAAEPDLRIGDVVLHEDHGIGVLRALETVEIDGVDP